MNQSDINQVTDKSSICVKLGDFSYNYIYYQPSFQIEQLLTENQEWLDLRIKMQKLLFKLFIKQVSHIHTTDINKELDRANITEFKSEHYLKMNPHLSEINIVLFYGSEAYEKLYNNALDWYSLDNDSYMLEKAKGHYTNANELLSGAGSYEDRSCFAEVVHQDKEKTVLLLDLECNLLVCAIDGDFVNGYTCDIEDENSLIETLKDLILITYSKNVDYYKMRDIVACLHSKVKNNNDISNDDKEYLEGLYLSIPYQESLLF